MTLSQRKANLMIKKSIQFKLFCGLGFVLAVAVANGLYSWMTVRNIHRELTNEIASSAARMDDARQITLGIAEMRGARRGVVLFSLQHHDDLLAQARSTFAAKVEEMRNTAARMDAGDLDPQERAEVSAIRPALEQWSKNFDRFSELSVTGHAQEADQIAREGTTPLMEALQKSAGELGRLSRLRQEAAARNVEASIDRTQAVDLILTCLLLLAGAGGLAVLAGMIKTMKRIAQAVMSGAGQVTNAASQLSEASASLAQGSSEQAASLEETSASMEEIRSMVRRNTENSQSSADIVVATGAKFEEANHALEEMERAMDEIAGSSKKISKIIKMICSN